MKDTLIYLSGPIAGLTYEGAEKWRERVVESFNGASHMQFLSPLRSKAFLKDHGVLGKTGYEENPLSSEQGVTTRDRWDTTRADIVFVNLIGATQVSIGTMIELGWADAMRRPIILCMEPGNIHEHCIVRGVSGFIVPTLWEGIGVLRGLVPQY